MVIRMRGWLYRYEGGGGVLVIRGSCGNRQMALSGLIGRIGEMGSAGKI